MTTTPSPADSTPAAEPDTSPVVVVHRWPWRRGEFGTMAFFVACILLIGLGVADGPVEWSVVGAAVIGTLWLLYHTKVSRVTRSQVTATLNGTRLSIASDAAVGRSAVDLSKVTTIGYRQFGSDECFVLSGDGQGVRLPIRVLINPALRHAFETTWDNPDIEHSVEATELYQRTIANV